MKLISMTEKVCEIWEYSGLTDTEKLNTLARYAYFLKQPLKLEMFVPCDEDGNVLDDVTKYNTPYTIGQLERIKEYLQAKEKVLFGGFKSIGRFKISSGFEEISILKFSNGNTQAVVTDFTQEKTKTKVCYTIEDLIEFNLTLTESAIKQLGL